MSQLIAIESTSLNPDTLVSLYRITLSNGAIIRLCNDATVSLDGDVYSAFPITAEGFEYDGKGALPRPSISIAADPAVIGLIVSPSGLVGCKFERIRTFSKYLDNGTSPDPTATLPIESYIIDRKTSHTSTVLKFELCSIIDQEGKRIPARQIVRDSCPFVYRKYSNGSFSYPPVMTCPYVGADYFNERGEVVQNPALDKCGKKISDCRKRFEQDPAGIPFGGFPGVGRIAN